MGKSATPSGGGGSVKSIMKIQLSHCFDDIINLDNLLDAWKEFIIGKKSKKDVLEFSANLMDNIILLHECLANGSYEHSGYQAFKITDPKPRQIHKAGVRDRLLHHAIYRILYPFYDKTFISGSFSCRLGMGTHKANKQFRKMFFKVSKNNTRTCWALKGDIRKFFASVNQEILIKILVERITDQRIINLLVKVIKSFGNGVGIPLGNLTSQLFANVYLNEFDQFVKHKLKARHYLRYADDFMVLSPNRNWLENLVPVMQRFLTDELKLELHPQKVFIKTISSGVDFLGWVNFPDHRTLRTKTKRRMFTRLKKNCANETLQSYLGMLKHGNAYKIKEELLNWYWLMGKK